MRRDVGVRGGSRISEAADNQSPKKEPMVGGSEIVVSGLRREPGHSLHDRRAGTYRVIVLLQLIGGDHDDPRVKWRYRPVP